MQPSCSEFLGPSVGAAGAAAAAASASLSQVAPLPGLGVLRTAEPLQPAHLAVPP